MPRAVSYFVYDTIGERYSLRVGSEKTRGALISLAVSHAPLYPSIEEGLITDADRFFLSGWGDAGQLVRTGWNRDMQKRE